MSQKSIAQDPDVMRLAHPQRCLAAMDSEFPAWEKVFGQYTWSQMHKVFGDVTLLTPSALNELVNDPLNRRLLEFTNLAAYAPGNAGTEMGSAFATVMYLRQVHFPQPQFVIDDQLLEMLENTDIADDIPVSSLEPPYSRCFIEFGRSRTSSERVPNIESGLHVLEGAYVEKGHHFQHGLGLYLMFTGSPVGHKGALDDATDSIFLPLDRPERSLKEALDWAYEQSAGIAHTLQLRVSPVEYLKHSFSCLKLLVKVLLYLNLPEARKKFTPDLTNALKLAATKKNPAKREKAHRMSRGLVDYILVQAPHVQREAGYANEGPGVVKRHWRRGHYRMQAYGPQYSLHRVIFLQPVLVGLASGLPDEAPRYLVR